MLNNKDKKTLLVITIISLAISVIACIPFTLAKLTQFELAEKANISEAMVKSIELSISWPSEKTLTNLAEALEIDIIRFFVPIALEEKEQNNLYNEIKSVIAKNFNNFLDEVIQKVKQ